MKRHLSLMLCLLLLFPLAACRQGESKGMEKYTEYYFDYFDTATTVVGYAESKEAFDATAEQIRSELERYHRLYDIYSTYEGIHNLCTVNSTEGGVHRPVAVDGEILSLLRFAKQMYKETNGTVNVAMGSVLSLWHDCREQALLRPDEAALPSTEDLLRAAEHTDIEQVIIDEEAGTVYLADPLMTLDVGAVAKGYATEQIAKALREQDVSGFMLNVGGNVRTVGHKPDGSAWTVGIENPDRLSADAYVTTVDIEELAVVTSGSYQRFYTVDGTSYHHIIHPETLFPAAHYLSVSVLCPDAGVADALSTALFCMPLEDGYACIADRAEVAVLWVLPDGSIEKTENFPTATDS